MPVYKIESPFQPTSKHTTQRDAFCTAGELSTKHKDAPVGTRVTITQGVRGDYNLETPGVIQWCYEMKQYYPKYGGAPFTAWDFYATTDTYKK